MMLNLLKISTALAVFFTAQCFLPLSKKVRFEPLTTMTAQPVSVFDSVFEDDILIGVDKQAQVGGLGHTLFDRLKRSPETLLEQAIESCLNRLGDNSPFVEYWWRDEWLSLEAHKDIDEMLGRYHGEFRYPNHAHVLYLHIATEVFGPTVLFLEDEINMSKKFSQLCIVPSKTNRLLRFRGDIAHAVPRPSFCWLDPSEGGTNTEIWTRQKGERNTAERRSVCLFNTWRESPPLDLSTIPPIEALKLQATENLTIAAKTLDNWKAVNLNIENKSRSMDENVRLKIGLLGDKKRRGRDERYINLFVDRAIKTALIASAPTILPVDERT